MSRKSKIDAVKKVEIVEQYLNGELSQKGAAKMCGVNKRSVQDWIRIYKTDGPEALLFLKTRLLKRIEIAGSRRRTTSPVEDRQTDWCKIWKNP